MSQRVPPQQISTAERAIEQLRRQSEISASQIFRGPGCRTQTGGLADRGQPQWTRTQLLGRLIELSGTAAHTAITFAAALISEFHQQRELVAWVRLNHSCFHPPDLASWALDLEALPVIRVDNCESAARVAYHLMCSAAFALVVVDLVDAGSRARISGPALARLAKLAQRHNATVLCLTQKDAQANSLGSMVSLRAETKLEFAAPIGAHTKAGFSSTGWLACNLHVLKDKHRGPGWLHQLLVRAPAGML